MKQVRIGCSGWMYDDWRGRLYAPGEPKRRWLELYARHFDTVEVNSTFYRLARRDTVAAWVEHTPGQFLFSVKASRYLTHIRRLADIDEGIGRFYEPLQPLIDAGRLGPVLWQLPENFHRNDERLDGWLEQIATAPSKQHTIEFRHESWFVPAVLAKLREHGVALTIGDHPKRPFQSHETTASWRFIRFHYGSRGRGGNYSKAELERWAQQIKDWRRTGDLYVYFNNDWRGFAPANAELLRRLVSRPSRDRRAPRSAPGPLRGRRPRDSGCSPAGG